MTESTRRVPGMSPLIDSDVNVSTISSWPSELTHQHLEGEDVLEPDPPTPTVLCVDEART